MAKQSEGIDTKEDGEPTESPKDVDLKDAEGVNNGKNEEENERNQQEDEYNTDDASGTSDAPNEIELGVTDIPGIDDEEDKGTQENKEFPSEIVTSESPNENEEASTVLSEKENVSDKNSSDKIDDEGAHTPYDEKKKTPEDDERNTEKDE